MRIQSEQNRLRVAIRKVESCESYLKELLKLCHDRPDTWEDVSYASVRLNEAKEALEGRLL